VALQQQEQAALTARPPRRSLTTASPALSTWYIRGRGGVHKTCWCSFQWKERRLAPDFLCCWARMWIRLLYFSQISL